VLAALHSPQPPPTASILTALLNEITTIPDNFVLVLDDYHVIEAQPVDAALTFLIQHLPPQMHLVIATREDPQLPLARLRVRGQLTERGTADLYLGLAELSCEQGDLEATRQYLLKSEALGEQAALPDWPYRLRRAQARIKEAQGDLDGALNLLDEAERLYYRTPVPDVRPIAALRTRVWVRQGRLAEAQGWARERGLSVDNDLSYLREFEHITLARVLIAQHKSDRADRTILEAMELLDRLLKAAEEGGRMGSVLEILILQALAHQAQGNIPLALASLEHALTLAEPEGYVRTFVDEGLPMAQLLTEAAARGIAPAYTGRLLAAFPNLSAISTTPLKIRTKDSWRENSKFELVEPLSQRELEILHLIAQGLSNREISERLFLALDTVKGHNRRIFDKLQVQRRTEAVARARELNLFKDASKP
jgi:LuxR family maltose regulon positive regulatory protein